MKLILVGHTGSQVVRKASRYLIDKYMPDFEVHHIEHNGDIKFWSYVVASYLRKLEDKYVVFALDDYLLSGSMEFEVPMPMPGGIVCAKLCKSTQEEHEEYPVTTQYCIWDRKFLISLLEKTTDPWDFEINGSKIFRETGKRSVLLNCLPYNVHSALSKRWEGVDLKGLSEEDIKEVQKLI